MCHLLQSHLLYHDITLVLISIKHQFSSLIFIFLFLEMLTAWGRGKWDWSAVPSSPCNPLHYLCCSLVILQAKCRSPLASADVCKKNFLQDWDKSTTQYWSSNIVSVMLDNERMKDLQQNIFSKHSLWVVWFH